MIRKIAILEYGSIVLLIVYFVLKYLEKIPPYDKEMFVVLFLLYLFLKPDYAIIFLFVSVMYFLLSFHSHFFHSHFFHSHFFHSHFFHSHLVKERYLFENFGNNDKIKTDKTIYFVWGSKKDGNEHGLGDKLRCLNYVYRYCNKNNIRLIFDAHQHEIGDYLKHSKSDDWKNIETKEITFMKHDMKLEDAEKYLKKQLETKNAIYIYAAMADLPDFEDKDSIDFLRYVLEPSDTFLKELDEKKSRLPENYTIQHMRFDDTVFTDDKGKKDDFEKYFKMINDSYSSTDVLISNSKEFKKYVKSKLPIYTIECGDSECTTAHMAGVGAYPGDKESYKNTLIDFYVMCGSKKIHTYSQYQWVSNFANWAARLYEIPLVNIQKLREWS